MLRKIIKACTGDQDKFCPGGGKILNPLQVEETSKAR